MTRPAPTPGLVPRAKAWWAWWLTTRPARANAKFGAAGGGVLTGGIAYSALFSVFAALTIGFTVFMAVLGRNEPLRQNLLDTLATSLPGLVDTGDGQGLLEPSDLVLSVGLNVTGLLAVVVLFVSATGALSSLRAAVRAMFDRPGPASNAVVGKLRDLAGLATAVLVSAVGTIALTSAADWLLGILGVGGGGGPLVRIVGVVVAFAVDAAVFAGIVVVLAGVRPHRRDLLIGSALAAVGIGTVRVLGTSVVAGSVGTNPLFASFAVIVTLLIWLNLLARIVLLAAAWTADPEHGQTDPGEPAAPAPPGELAGER